MPDPSPSRRRRISTLAACALVAACLLAVWLARNPVPPSQPPPSTDAGQSPASAQPAAHTPVFSTNNAAHSAASPSAAQSPPPSVRPPQDGWAGQELADSPIRKLVRSATEIASAPATGAGQGPDAPRVRILRADGQKYPLLRVEPADPSGQAGGGERVMVADHLIVKQGAGLDERAFLAGLRKRGYEARKKMLAPGTWLVALPWTNPGELLANFGKARADLAALGNPEPDYLVEHFAVPNDTYEHLLWGMHNVAGKATVTTGTLAGQAFSESGKMIYAGEIPDAGITAALVACGYGAVAGDFPPAVSNNIALIERGGAAGAQVTFATKVANAKAAGAAAVLLYNNVAGGFSGTLGNFGDWLPTVPISQSAGQALLAGAAGQSVTITGEPSGKDIHARAAWETATGSAQVLVGVIDTGIDYTHPDLAANIWVNPGESGPDGLGGDKATNGVDDDSNGFIDDVRGWDFANDDNNPTDDNNHGTHCAGTIGGVGNNANGVVGVNWTVKMAAIKFLSASGSGYTSDGIDSVYYGTLIGADLTSNSWGGGGAVDALRDAIEDANSHGILFVAAAGNSASPAPSYPAGYDNANIISVAATDSADQIASFSNYGVPHVDLGAPGVGILSTVPVFREPDYAFFNGTSMACPHVAGAAALLRARSPSMPHLDLRARLLATVDPVAALAGKTVTGGRLNLAAALDGVYEAPLLELAAVAVSDPAPGGNGDTVPNPGETVSIAFTVRNLGYQGATAVTGTLATADPNATVTDGTAAFGDIAGRGETSALDPLAIRIVSEISPLPHTVACTLTLADGTGGTWVLPLEIRVSNTYRLQGSVLLDGAPLAGATVAYTGPAGGSVATGANGAFDIPVPSGDFSLQASFLGGPLSVTDAQTLTTPPTQTGIVFNLTTATVSGTVVDDDTGAPVPGATVTFLGPVNESLATDGNGVFTHTRIYGRPAEWSVNAGKPSAYDYPTSAQTVTAPPGAAGLAFRLGYPRIALGAGSEGIEVTLAPGATATRTITLRNPGVADLLWQFGGLANGGGTPGALLGEFAPPPAIAGYQTALGIDGSAYDGEHLCWFLDGTLYRQRKDGTLAGQEYLPETVIGFDGSWRLACFDGRWFWFEEKVASFDDPGHKFSNLHAVDLATHQIVETIEVDRRIYTSVSGNEILGWANAECGALAEGVFLFYWATYDPVDAKRYIDLARIDRATGALLSHYRLPAEVNWPHENVRFTDFTYFNGNVWMIESRNNFALSGWYQKIHRLDPATGAILETIAPAGSATTWHYREIFADETGALWLLKNYPDPRMVQRVDSGVRLWMRAGQAVGTLAAGEEIDIEVALDAAGLAAGTHHGALRFSSNDPDRPALFVPVVLKVAAGDPTNTAPTIAASSPASPASLDENQSQIFSITGLADPDGDPLSIAWSLDGVLATGTNSQFTFHADYFSQGAHALAVSASDGRGGVATRLWQIFVRNINRAPVAQNASHTVANSDTLEFALEAADPDNEPLEWEILSPPASGGLTGKAPSMAYTPAPGFTGTVSFTFKVSDGTLDSNIATVTIQVGHRDIEASLAPITVSAVYGEKPTRTITLRNAGTTPLRWTAPMTWNTQPSYAGHTIATVALEVPSAALPSGRLWAGYLRGIAWDGTNFLTGALELTSSYAYYRSHLVRHDATTGQIVGPTLPPIVPDGFSQEYIETLGWSGDGIWALNRNSVVDGSSRILEYGLGATTLIDRHYIPQFASDFGPVNRGIAVGHHGVWIFVTATSGDPASGVYRLEPGTKNILDRFDPPYGPLQGGPIAYGNGALWFGTSLGGPLLKVNPFNGQILSQTPLASYLDAQDAAWDGVGGMLYREYGAPVHRVFTGDFALMTPDGGTLAGGAETTITVAFDSALARSGTHTGHIHLLSDDPDEPELLVPFTFTVGPQAGDTAPVIDAFSPATPAAINARERLPFTVTASDIDNDPLTYRWYFNNVRMPQLDGKPVFDYVPGGGDAGGHVVRVEVDDGRGGVVVQDWIVNVSAPPLGVTAMANPTRGSAPLDVAFSSTAAGGTGANGAVAGETAMVVVEAENFHRYTDHQNGSKYAYWSPLGDNWWESLGGMIVHEMSGSYGPLVWTNTSEAAYDIQFPASGAYYLWMRVRPGQSTENSCWVGMDGVQVGGAFDDTPRTAYETWYWVRHTATFSVTAGLHTFQIRGRERDYGVDRFVFTTDPAFVPEGYGPLWENARLPALTHAWTFGDGQPGSTNPAPSHVYAAPGQYTATVEIGDGAATASDSAAIDAFWTYSAWTSQHLTGRPEADRHPLANPDGDRFPNLLEYALGLDPLAADGEGAISETMVKKDGETYLAITYTRRTDRGDIEFVVEVGGDLAAWTSNTGGGTVTVIESTTGHGDGRETVTERDATPARTVPRRFIRLRVEQQ